MRCANATEGDTGTHQEGAVFVEVTDQTAAVSVEVSAVNRHHGRTLNKKKWTMFCQLSELVNIKYWLTI